MSAAVAAVEETPQESKADVDDVKIVDADPTSDTKQLITTKTFTVEWINPETGERHGPSPFTVERPTLGMVAQIAVLKSRYNGGERIDIHTDFMNEMRAFLQVTLSDSPKWWTPETFFTADPLREVWEHVQRWLKTFQRRVG